MNAMIAGAHAAKRGRSIGALRSSPTVGTSGPLAAALKRVETLRAVASAAREQGDLDAAELALDRLDAALGDLEAGRLRDPATGVFVGADGEPLRFDGGVSKRPFPARQMQPATARELFAAALSASRIERASRERVRVTVN